MQCSRIARIRLAGGSTPNAGRVEVYVNGEWGTVCDDSWDIIDAHVVCNQLGYPGAVRAELSAHYGEGSGRIWLDNVACAVSSLSLQDCPKSEIGDHNCNHKEDAGVECLPLDVPTTVAPGIARIRLAGGSIPNAGRVEVFVNGEWGTVCDDSWDITDAHVVCRQLGYPGAVRAELSAHYGEGSGRIWLDDVACAVSSLSLQDCLKSEIGDHNCDHKEDAGVECLPLEVPTTVAPGIASIRLAGGGSPNSGRVEVFVNGEWGTVCDDSWDITDAHVVCNQLGYPGAVRATSKAYYGEGSGRIWLDDVACGVSSLSLQDCPKSEIGDHNCNHKEDAGVECLPLEVPTTVAPGIASIRLAGGSSPNAGRVEVFVNGEWGTVCDDSWDITDAFVVCNQLGYPGAVRATSKAYYGEGSGRIWLDNVACAESSLSLQDCPKSEIGDHNCNHKEDAGVECLPLDVPTSVASGIASIRLAGGSSPNAGRVEVFVNGEWGTVCDHSWDITDANVVCRQLGYPGAVRARSSAHFGRGSGRIWLDDVACADSSLSLQDCPMSEIGVHNCNHKEDAGVKCLPLEVPTTVAPGIESIRLVDGSTPNAGRVEVFVNGEWGTVCDHSWDITDANVVCRQLGYPGAVRARSSAHFGRGSGRIWLDDVACADSSLSLQDCPMSEIGVHNCNHKEDAGVKCLPLEVPTTVAPGIESIRLVDGSTPNAGRVEVFVNGEWGTVCDHSWDITDANVVCRQLGYPGAVRARSSAHFGRGSGRIWLDDVACADSSLSLQDCPMSEIGVHNCNHKEDAGVKCLPLEVPTTVAPGIESIRLVDGSTPNAGRVEVFVNGEWGTVCDHSWDITDANVVCRQLGYPGAVRARSSAHYGEGSGRIWLDDVACADSSLSLQDCPMSEIGVHNCNHKEDAGVKCLPLEVPTTVAPGIASIRLVGGSSPNAGRVEVFVNGEWGTVCDNSWDINDAAVVCRQLGYPGAVRATSKAHYGEGSGRIWLDNVACGVSSLSLQDCPKSEIGDHNCNHKEDAGVECLPLEVPTAVAPGIASIRLAGGSIPNAGRVEVFVNGEWGTVCDDSWDITDANVVCNQLGYPGAVRATSKAYYGEGSGRIWLDNVACGVSSLSLQDCPKSEIGDHNCNHKEDAGVECLPLEVPTTVAPGIESIRLAGGSTPNAGRVEVFVNGEWGTVCDDSWDITDAHVVCRQLGYPGAVRARSSAHYGEGSGRIWLDDVACGVSSLSLQDCPKSEIGDHNCNHKEDAGVECLPLEVPTTAAPGIVSIRLAGGSTPHAGRVEAFVHGEWGTVCDDSWDITDAAVVCRQLGYPGAVRARSSAHYGEGSVRIWLDNVECVVSSLTLQDCPKNDIVDHNCGHNKNAAVVCFKCEDCMLPITICCEKKMFTHKSSFIFTVSPETLQFVVAPTDVTVEEGEVVQLFCEVNNEAASRFWFKGMSQISSEDSEESVHVTIDGNLIFVNTEVGFTGRYTCLARSPSGQEARASAFLTVTALHTATNVPSRQLYFLKRPEDTELALGDIVVFHCEVDDASAEITWFKDDIQIAQGLINGLVLLRDNSLIITDIEVHHHGTYKCVATSSDSRRAEVTARALCTLSTSWLKDGSPLVYNQRTIEIVDRVLLRDVTADDSGLYVCVAADSEGHVVAQARAAVDVLPHTLNNDDCGIVSSPEVLEDANTRGVHSGRVVGGRDAGRGSAPWMARLFLIEGLHGRGGFVCGGSLIDRQWVVTAAHCFNIIENLSARQLYVILGDHDTLATEDSQIYVLVEAFYLHEEYDIDTFNNDIALIKLVTPLQRYSSYVRPICLANRTIDRELLVFGVSGRVSGWGATTEGGAPSLYLQEVQIPFIPYPTCKVNFRPKYVFTKNMFCAGYERGGADACQGDSGGPYAVEKASRWFLMGIVSWGIGCGRHGSYGAYTRYSKYHQWVKRVITSY
ncbi:putative deleted in malignant brain tumors 1 protein-like isoform X1 [Apostichopus japonicus]|uniref:Putative deleted in malignant brain tumors 1 protein-like isoform X1 n=1 Tax=Stichopus japonicus TaxID=307972 RepID=A0A2G8K2Y5_STIJA|nr:putative deleted in malignant brain tumors 1 protein-like isoform X1 [Apostichopus japonicus]